MLDLKTALSTYADANGGGEGVFETPVPGFTFMRTSRATLPRHMVYRPSLCIVAQGEKQVLFGDETLTYGEMQALVFSVEIPALGWVSKASVEKPLLGLILELDLGIMREVMEELEAPAPSQRRWRRGRIRRQPGRTACRLHGTALTIAFDTERHSGSLSDDHARDFVLAADGRKRRRVLQARLAQQPDAAPR